MEQYIPNIIYRLLFPMIFFQISDQLKVPVRDPLKFVFFLEEE